MILELHQVTIAPLIQSLSMTVNEGELLCLTGASASGKTTLLRAVMGFVPVDSGYISIDGELLTPRSAPYFRRHTAYVPQHLSLPDGETLNGMLASWADLTEQERYMLRLMLAAGSGKPLLIADEPPVALTAQDEAAVDQMLREAAARGATVLAVNARIEQNQVRL